MDINTQEEKTAKRRINKEQKLAVIDQESKGLSMTYAAKRASSLAATVDRFLSQQEIRAVSPYEYHDKDEGRINLSELIVNFHAYLIHHLLVTKETPKAYWIEQLDKRVKEMYKQQLASMSAELAFNPRVEEVGKAELVKFLSAITLNPNALTVATFQHFIWQVKRKLLHKPTTYHLMNILWGTKQGSGKTTAIKRFLSPIVEEYIYTGLNFDKMGDDRYYPLYELFPVVFCDEMPKAAKADVELIKNVITSSNLTGRILNKHVFRNYRQRATFIGATNSTPDNLLRDTSGMRRFYSIEARPDMDWEVIKNINAYLIWCSVDESQDEAYIIPYLEELAMAQEETREKDVLECFIEEGYLAAQPAVEEAPVFETRTAYNLFRGYAERSGHVKNIIALQTFNKQLLNRHGFLKAPHTNKNLPVKFYGVLDARTDRTTPLSSKRGPND